MIAWEYSLACVNIYILNEDRRMTVTVLMRGLARAVEDTRIQLTIVGDNQHMTVGDGIPSLTFSIIGWDYIEPTGTITIEADTDRSISQTFQYGSHYDITSEDLTQALTTVGTNKYWIVYSGDSVYAPAVGYGTMTVEASPQPEPTPTPTPDDPTPPTP